MPAIAPLLDPTGLLATAGDGRGLAPTLWMDKGSVATIVDAGIVLVEKVICRVMLGLTGTTTDEGPCAENMGELATVLFWSSVKDIWYPYRRSNLKSSGFF